MSTLKTMPRWLRALIASIFVALTAAGCGCSAPSPQRVFFRTVLQDGDKSVIRVCALGSHWLLCDQWSRSWQTGGWCGNRLSRHALHCLRTNHRQELEERRSSQPCAQTEVLHDERLAYLGKAIAQRQPTTHHSSRAQQSFRRRNERAGVVSLVLSNQCISFTVLVY